MRTELVAAAVVLVLLAVAAEWVLSDARRHESHGRPVILVIGRFTLERPEAWAVLCLLGSVVFLPTYLVARSHR